MIETHPVTILTFTLYVAGTFLLAAVSHRFLGKNAFLGEYFLGSRGLRSWSLAFAFAATATSAGSFIGFPALIYTYGWVLALWIASYMIYPLCAMGVLGKRLNQVARKSGALTIPDVLRDRFDSPTLAVFTSSTILLFTTCNLVAQFKAGALILEETFNLPGSWGYTAGLLLFAAVVVAYTAYGGFRAVVWTDVLQGIVMGLGVLFLLPVVLWQAGGLESVTKRLSHQPAQAVTAITGGNNDLAFVVDGGKAPAAIEYVGSAAATPWVRLEETSNGQVLTVGLPGDRLITAGEVRAFLESTPEMAGISIHNAYGNDGSGTVAPTGPVSFVSGEDLAFGPGKRSDGLPFHPLGLAISYFLMWAITAMGQPGMMVRLMAFKDSRTLKRAIVIVTFYFSLIYIPLVFIFTASRLLVPYLSPEDADKAMVIVAAHIVGNLGTGYAVLAAFFLAAPFAAVMSTVDSFLLLISSAIVRDFYQRTVNPDVSDRTVRRLSYGATVFVGVLVTILATRRIDFLQYIVIFTSSGFACTFLAPVSMGIFWKGMTRQGALASAIGGLVAVLALFSPSLIGAPRIDLFGFHPVIWGLAASFFLGWFVSRLSGPPQPELVERYFMEPERP